MAAWGSQGGQVRPGSSCMCEARRGSLGIHVWVAELGRAGRKTGAWERTGCARG